MKNSIITMFVFGMMLCTSLFSQNLVYNYKASIKRLDPQFSIKTKKVDGKSAKYVASSYKVSSDTLNGWIVLPVCVGCNAQGIESSLDDDNTGIGYFVRKGDKLSAKAKIPYVLKANVKTGSAIFAAYKDCQDPDTTPHSSIKAANKAWMWLDYSLPIDSTTISSKYVLKEVREELLPIGYLGVTNTGVMMNTEINHTGFGDVKVQSYYKAADLGWCVEGEASEGSCQYISSIGGTLIGYPEYLGLCGSTPMWDLCYDKIRNPHTVNDGVICGTWTLKYNATVTKNYNNAETAEKKEMVILRKLNATTADIINGNYEEN